MEREGICNMKGRKAAVWDREKENSAAVSGDAQNINNAARNMRVAHSFMTGLNVPPPCARAF